MSTKTEFSLWLRRKNKSFIENLQFALKAWQSVEFTLSNKFDIILNWIIEELPQLNNSIQLIELKDLLKQRAPSGFIKIETKCLLVNTFLDFISSYHDNYENRAIPELLKHLLEVEFLQDLYRSDYVLYNQVYGSFLKQYEKFIGYSNTEKSIETESTFISSVISLFKETAKSTGNIHSFSEAYTIHAVQQFAELLLRLKALKVDIFPEFLLIEEILNQGLEEKFLLKRALEGPLHLQLLLIECAIIQRRNVELFQRELIERIFKQLPENGTKDGNNSQYLKVAAFTLETFHKHEVPFLVDGKDGIKELGRRINEWISETKKDHLNEVLALLCATLRYNPLILEHYIFQITCWMIVAEKNEYNGEKKHFEEFMILLLEVFRKLSRAEKFVVNLLKAIKEWICNNELPETTTKRKRKTTDIDTKKDLTKKPKTENEQELVVNTKDLNNTVYNEFVEQIFAEKREGSNSKQISSHVLGNARNSFSFLSSYWPSESIGVAFSTIITTLVSKPALAVWKTLIFSLKNLLEKLQAQKDSFDNNNLFYLDLHCAMLCQYFSGCKLVEQADKFLESTEENRSLTKTVLSCFGRLILSHEHENRAIQSFLELSYNASVFDLVYFHYKPDGLEISEVEYIRNMHDFLTDDEWSLIEQRVLNFGKDNTQFLMNRLLLQRKQAQMLALKSSQYFEDLTVESVLKYGKDIRQIESLITDESSKWFVSYLNKTEKLELSNLLLKKTHLYNTITDDLQCLESLALTIFSSLCASFSSFDVSYVKSLELEIKEMYSNTNEIDDADLIKQAVVKIHKNLQLSLKNILVEEVSWALESLEQIPLAYLRGNSKWWIYIVLTAVYRDLSSLEEKDLSIKAYNLILDTLSFGEHLPIFKYSTAVDILSTFPVSQCWNFYEQLFSTIKSVEKGSEEFLQSLSGFFHDNAHNLKSDHCKLLILTIESIANAPGNTLKLLRHHLDNFLEIYGNYVQEHFREFCEDDGFSKKHKKFVEKTLAGFPYYLNHIIRKSTMMNTDSKKEDNSQLKEETRRLTKIYLGFSQQDCKNNHAIRLVKVALEHRSQLHLEPAEIEVILNAFWRKLNDSLKNDAKFGDKNCESIVKLVIDNKTNEDFLLTLKNLADFAQSTSMADNYENILTLLTLIATCSFSTVKGAIFNEHFKHITASLSIKFLKNEHQQYAEVKQVQGLLKCYTVFVENRMVPLSIDTLDGVLSFLVKINIKKFVVDDNNIGEFHEVHLAMSNLMTALVKHRHVLLMDRVPQFMQIFKDLLQAIVWYKNDRQKSINFTTKELDDLGDLALKLATLMSIITTHALHFKRVAPFILTFIINLMVDSKRPTTLHLKIKTHIESICYDLISICDHRVGRFILRSSNEAGRNLYESLVKDHQKYRKFKGKV